MLDGNGDESAESREKRALSAKFEGERVAYRTVYSHDNPGDGAHGWIQWKGTDVCIDLHCACGSHGHCDGYGVYAVRCTDCGRKYVVGQNVKLIELDTPELIAANELYSGVEYKPFSDTD